MARTGCKPLGVGHVDHLHGSELARRRLEMILRTLSGELTIDAACHALGIHASRFHQLRNRWLQQSVELLEPRPTGRPPQDDPPASAAQLSALEAEAEQLRAELDATRLRLELGRVMPHLLHSQPAAPEPVKKKNPSRTRPL